MLNNRLKDSRTQGLKDSRTQGLKDSRTQGLKDSRTQGGKRGASRAVNSTAPRVLVFRRQAVGDIVLLGSLFRNLRLHWPQAHIALLANPTYAPAAALHVDIDCVYSVPKALGQRLRLICELRRARYTHVLDLDNTTTTTLLTWLSGASTRVTYHREGYRVRRGWAYTSIVPIPARDYHTLHITESYLALLSAIGVPIRTRDLGLSPSDTDIARVQKFARHSTLSPASAPSKKHPRVLIHPGASHPARVWPLEHFAAVCDQLYAQLNAEVFLIAGPSERTAVRTIREAARSQPAVIDEPLSIGEFAALCRHFDLMLCNDSGPMHIAAGMGTRVVALFGAQNAILWGPIGAEQKGHTILQTPRPCTCSLPDLSSPCSKSHTDRSYCVRKLSVEQVVEAVRTTLAKPTR